MLHAVIMAGGSGTRFWPLSRRAHPKQFLSLSGERSLIQMAYDRCQPWIPAEQFWVVTNERLAEMTQTHLPDVPSDQVLLEPCARNTAPCIALAAACLLEKDPDAVMLVMPADHVIGPHSEFEESIQRAHKLIQQDPEKLVLFGVPPTYPSTGFGYIERGEEVGGVRGAYDVSSFREKPDRDTAENYVRFGTFYWNCGIFLWRADRILNALRTCEAEIAAHAESLKSSFGTEGWSDQLAETFPKMKSISIDYAVLEREQGIAVVEASFDWDDVGSWAAMERLVSADENGNTVIGMHRSVETNDCIVRTTPDHLVATLGVENLIIVHSEDATLIASRDDENAVREIVALLQERGDEAYL